MLPCDENFVVEEEWLDVEADVVSSEEYFGDPILDVGAEIEVAVEDNSVNRLQPVAGSSGPGVKRRRPRHGLDLHDVVVNDGYSLRRHVDRHPGLGIYERKKEFIFCSELIAICFGFSCSGYGG